MQKNSWNFPKLSREDTSEDAFWVDLFENPQPVEFSRPTQQYQPATLLNFLVLHSNTNPQPFVFSSYTEIPTRNPLFSRATQQYQSATLRIFSSYTAIPTLNPLFSRATQQYQPATLCFLVLHWNTNPQPFEFSRPTLQYQQHQKSKK